VWGIAHVYLLVGFQNRFLVTMRWLWAYLTFQRGARLITEDVMGQRPKGNLRSEDKPPGATTVQITQREKGISTG
jgi:hypothetical protein